MMLSFFFIFSGIYVQTEITYTPKSYTYAAYKHRWSGRYGSTDRSPWRCNHVQFIPAISAKQNLCKCLEEQNKTWIFFMNDHVNLALKTFSFQGT